MVLVQLATPSHFRLGRLERIGFHRHLLYVALRLENRIEIWNVHCFIPSSWRKLYSLTTQELFYAYFTISSQNCVYALVLALFEADSVGQVTILKVNPYGIGDETCRVTSFALNHNCANLFEEIALENVGLGWGEEKGVYIFDRSMVMGRIPFWRVFFDENESTFSIKSCHILRDETTDELKCSRFPIVISGDRRMVLKLSNNNEITIYDKCTEKWKILWPNEGSDLDLSLLHTRAISETFGHDWHRCCAIESPLSVFVDNEFCIFKVYQGGQHIFYTFTIDESTNTYCLQHCSSTRLEKRLETMFYLHCAEGRRIAFVNKYLIAFVSIQPPTLRELSFWAFQRNFASKDDHGLWYGGVTEGELREMCHFSNAIRLI